MSNPQNLGPVNVNNTVSKNYFNNFLLIKNTIDEFFLECDLSFDENSYLLEGYLN
jgi:hypothetical protein